MPITTIYNDSGCEWIDVEAPTDEDMKYVQERDKVNTALLEDTLDPNH